MRKALPFPRVRDTGVLDTPCSCRRYPFIRSPQDTVTQSGSREGALIWFPISEDEESVMARRHGSRKARWDRNLIAHTLNCKHRAERANWKLGVAVDIQSPPHGWTSSSKALPWKLSQPPSNRTTTWEPSVQSQEPTGYVTPLNHQRWKRGSKEGRGR